ncbi:RNA methyltransferase [Membranicola marinus]|uniref:tRNA (guanosine(18)-2'-O)-methyltransferase n=1 Tax=Membranihabitans marinus TaxID=1227546 RepID=A0A953LCT1_9BACT|nr:RNA methyltransferase [Membranihabitans marinus]MBY5959831.1 RNA methyltransferase [Membranihabitans marinus]
MKITAHRDQKYIQLANHRQPDWTVILENVSDWHNVGAVMRSCDAVGIGDLYVLYSDVDHRPNEIGLGKRTTAGTRKWVQVHYFEDLDACFKAVREKYHQIYTTYLSSTEKTRTIYDLDFTLPGAYLFGNEHDGVSDEAVSKADGNFCIPQHGMVDSLNISVACAVTLFEGMRQRRMTGKYPESEKLLPHAVPYYEQYLEMHRNKWSQLPIVEER